MELPEEGLVLSRMLAEVLDVDVGDTLQVEVLEGRRPIRSASIGALVDDNLGLQAYMRLDALHRLMREGQTVTGTAITIDPLARDDFYAAVKATPVIAGVSMRDAALDNFRKTMAEHMYLSIFINVMFAAVIASISEHFPSPMTTPGLFVLTVIVAASAAGPSASRNAAPASDHASW